MQMGWGRQGQTGAGRSASCRMEHTLDGLLFAATVAADRALFASFRSSLDTSIVRSEICDTEPLELMGGFGSDAPGSNLGSLQNTY